MTIWSVQAKMDATIDSPIREIISDRGNTNIEAFIQPDIKDLHDPSLMKGMNEGTNRVVRAIQNGEKVRVMGDYDADGITSTYSMLTLLDHAGAVISYEIPDRKDGYGLSKKLIDHAYRDGIDLIITCDNGIAAVEAVEYAKEKGIDVVVTDHHEPQDVLPDCVIVNPHQPGCEYPFKKLAGCAVAWKFCQEVLRKLEGAAGIAKSYEVLDAVAIGTVADVMDLVGENRILVHYGLKRLNSTQNIGLQELYKALELDTKTYPVDASTIGFKIGPALNATGRLVSASEAVEMLLERSRLRALRSAKYLAELNNERKIWTEAWVKKAVEYFGEEPEDKILVFRAEWIPEGIVGNIASKIKEKYNRPVLIMTRDESGSFYKGSGRSIPKYNLFDNIMKIRDLFIAAGGHGMACGFSIHEDHVGEMITKLNAACKLTPEDMQPTLLIDYDIDYTLLNTEFAEEIAALAPFGKGNPKPKFMLTDVKVIDFKPMGKEGNHLKLRVAANDVIFECVGWNMIEKMRDIQRGHKGDIWLDVAFTPGINEWNNRKSLQLMLEDIRVAMS